jgi:2-polyprenyl-6-methoxyphenol hydroxylase-like FAD-dependent oxidoreductase
MCNRNRTHPYSFRFAPSLQLDPRHIDGFFFRTGYDSLVTTRSDLLQLLVSQIPPYKIHFSKRIVSFTANKDEVVIRCADDTTFQGDILIGADGAFSKVRELLYKQVAKKGILPRQDAVAVAADVAAATVATAAALLDDGSSETVTAEAEREALKGGHIHLVGVTRALDVEKFGVLLEDDSRCETVVGNTLPHSVSTFSLDLTRGNTSSLLKRIITDHEHPSHLFQWSYFTVPGNRICWSVNMEIDDNTLREQRARAATSSFSSKSPPSPTPSSPSRLFVSSTDSSQFTTAATLGWEAEESNTIAHSLLVSEECRTFQLPTALGGKLGDLMDATPKDQMARAISEETLFETWHHGRTLLIGDACHRMFPNAAHQGATNAIQDAVILANLFHDLPSASAENLAELFKDFQADRFPHAKAQMLMNRKVDRLLSGQVQIKTSSPLLHLCKSLTDTERLKPK